MSDSVDRLYQAVLAARTRDPAFSRTAKLIREGMPKMAKKLAEEAVEVGLDAVQGNREAVILESADLIYNLIVVLAEAGITPDEVWREMDRREQLYGMAEKLPKSGGEPGGNRPVAFPRPIKLR
ncbi:MAG: phosphoribosyl-ATP diphosphatase [Bosea sp.]|jgi:phosphoribosyl-ATP pyrophosphohydrolase|nr:phosphoribosyl-ATP diphosphatase [Bosea sp. (in: a-proteobacteria)]